MNKYFIAEAVTAVNERLKDHPKTHVTVRTLKLWGTKKVLSPTKGSGPQRYFDDDGLDEVVSVAKLRYEWNQGFEDIHNIRRLLDADPLLNATVQRPALACFVDGVENVKKAGRDPGKEIEAFKRGERFLVYDEAYDPPFLLVRDLSKSYFKEEGKVYRALESITSEDGEPLYFKPEDIEKHLSWVEEIDRECRPCPPHCHCRDISKEAEEIRTLIREGLMIYPAYRYNGEDYFSREDIDFAANWTYLHEDYGFSYDELRALRQRIEFDIEHYFYVPDPDKDIILEPSLRYEFEKRIAFFNWCLSGLHNEVFFLENAKTDHTKEDSVRTLRDYLDGYLFLCMGMSAGVNGNIHLKRTPIERLSPEQIERALSQERFTREEVKKIIDARETELKALRNLLKGGK